LKKKIYISSDIKKIEIERKLEQCITIVKFSLDFDKKNNPQQYTKIEALLCMMI
jgi:hypothetical protein